MTFSVCDLPQGAEVALVLPTYRQLDYAQRAIDTFFETTPDGVVFVVDDASPDWHYSWLRTEWTGRVSIHRFLRNGGLTRSWNKGISAASRLGAKYAIAGNSDILFSPGWLEPLKKAIDAGFSLVGPVSNAPGNTIGQQQDVRKYYPGYVLSDDARDLATTARRLADANASKVVEAPLNGFFLFAKTEDWCSGAYDEIHAFRPCNELNSKGQPNPTPLMTLNEDELQRRWHKLGRRTGAVCDSFIFHYRAVSRGERFRSPGWFRRTAS